MPIIFDNRFDRVTDAQRTLPYREMATNNTDPSNIVVGAGPLGDHSDNEEDRIKFLPVGPGGKPCMRFRLYKADRESYDIQGSLGYQKSSVLRAELGYYISGVSTVEPIDGTPRWYWTSFWVDPGYDSERYSSVFQLHNAATHYVSGAHLNTSTGLISLPVGFRHRYQVVFNKNSGGNAAATAPGGLIYGNTYWVYNPTDHPTDFKLCTTLANCNAGTTIALTSKGTYDGVSVRTVAPANVMSCEWTLLDKNLHHPSFYAGQQNRQFYAYNFVDTPGWGDQPRSSDGKVGGMDKFLWTGKSMDTLASGWNDVVIRAVWSSTNTGELTIWVNGKKIYTEKKTPNQGYEQMMPFFKIGIYAADLWPSDNRPYMENFNQGVVFANTTNMEDSFSGFMKALGTPEISEIFYPYNAHIGGMG